MKKIEKNVNDWRQYLHTPTEDDIYLGVNDDNFRDEDYLDDDQNEFKSAAYKAEFDSFMNSNMHDMVEYDAALSQIDDLFIDPSNIESPMGDTQRLFGEGFSMQRIENAEDFKKLILAMEKEASEGDGISWTNSDIEFDSIDEMFESNTDDQPTWMEFIEDLRNGRYGELPEDYDGLADPTEEAN